MDRTDATKSALPAKAPVKKHNIIVSTVHVLITWTERNCYLAVWLFGRRLVQTSMPQKSNWQALSYSVVALRTKKCADEPESSDWQYQAGWLNICPCCHHCHLSSLRCLHSVVAGKFRSRHISTHGRCKCEKIQHFFCIECAHRLPSFSCLVSFKVKLIKKFVLKSNHTRWHREFFGKLWIPYSVKRNASYLQERHCVRPDTWSLNEWLDLLPTQWLSDWWELQRCYQYKPLRPSLDKAWRSLVHPRTSGMDLWGSQRRKERLPSLQELAPMNQDLQDLWLWLWCPSWVAPTKILYWIF